MFPLALFCTYLPRCFPVLDMCYIAFYQPRQAITEAPLSLPLNADIITAVADNYKKNRGAWGLVKYQCRGN